jgi:hypothetical protein
VPYLPHLRPDHDETLIARLALDDLDARDGATARTLVAECPACAELLADLSLIASATAALPAPRRTRDFRLTDADAARLRPSGWRGLVARFGTPGFAFTRPLAAGLATLGIAGLVLASLPSGLAGSAASAPQGAFNTTGGPVQAQDAGAAPSAAALAPVVGPEAATGSKAGASSPAPAYGGAAISGQGTGSRDASASPDAALGVAPASPGVAAGIDQSTAAEAATGSGSAMTPLVLLSIALLAIGLGLAGLRLLAGRLV